VRPGRRQLTVLRAKTGNSVFIPRGKNDNLGGNTKQPEFADGSACSGYD
jgi:hypothetical protein